MKVIFKPLAWFVEWFGKIIRIIWNGKRTPNSVSQDLLSTRKNRITGTSVLALLLSVVGIWLSVTPSDIDRLEKNIDRSFERMEQLDYLASTIDTSNTNQSIKTYTEFRGETKLIMTVMRDQMRMADALKSSEKINDTVLLNITTTMIQSSQSIRNYSISFFNRLNIFGIWRGMNCNVVDSAYLANVLFVSNQFNEAFNNYNDEQSEVLTDLKELSDKYQKNNQLSRRDRKRLIKLCRQMTYGKTIVDVNEKLYEMLDVFYEYFVALQLNEMYGQTIK